MEFVVWLILFVINFLTIVYDDIEYVYKVFYANLYISFMIILLLIMFFVKVV